MVKEGKTVELRVNICVHGSLMKDIFKEQEVETK